MIKKLDHVGIAVADIDRAIGIYKALGLEETHREAVATQRVKAAFLPLGGTRLELLEPTAEDSPIARFLHKRGPGIHHLCFAVDDLDGTIEELASAGYRLLNRQAVPGADGKRVAFLHPEAGNGVLIELSEDGD
jgi:methylmalonyl-CoA/ethylmalonyl-CoA epimerase